MTTKHTPGPWQAQSRSVSDNSLVVKDSIEFNEICCLRDRELRDYSEEDRVAMANAEFIVRACNSHADLLAALERFARAMEQRSYPELQGIASDAFAAIAKARGEA